MSAAAPTPASRINGLGGGIYNGFKAAARFTWSTALSAVTPAAPVLPGHSYPHGGGIYNTGSLTLTIVRSAATPGSPVGNGAGGGIANWGTGVATVTNSTISNNTACKPAKGTTLLWWWNRRRRPADCW